TSAIAMRIAIGLNAPRLKFPSSGMCKSLCMAAERYTRKRCGEQGLSGARRSGNAMARADMRTVIVAAGIVIENGRVLLTQRKAGAHLAGMWEFPGGKVEAGEDPRAALARELEEELGIAVAIGDVVDVTFH